MWVWINNTKSDNTYWNPDTCAECYRNVLRELSLLRRSVRCGSLPSQHAIPLCQKQSSFCIVEFHWYRMEYILPKYAESEYKDIDERFLLSAIWHRGMITTQGRWFDSRLRQLWAMLAYASSARPPSPKEVQLMGSCSRPRPFFLLCYSNNKTLISEKSRSERTQNGWTRDQDTHLMCFR